MIPALMEFRTEANVVNILGIVLQFIFNVSYSRNKKKPGDLHWGGKSDIRE